jgi:hypothetical protein
MMDANYITCQLFRPMYKHGMQRVQAKGGSMKDGMLEIGDRLYTYGRHSSAKQYAGVIDRVTKTMAFIGKTKLQRKYHNGTYNIGCDKWPRRLYRIASDDDILEIKNRQTRENLVRECGKIDFSKLNNETLEAIIILSNNHEGEYKKEATE